MKNEVRKNKNEENIEGRQKKDWWRGFQGWNNTVLQFFFKSYYITIHFKIWYLRKRIDKRGKNRQLRKRGTGIDEGKKEEELIKKKRKRNKG